VPFFLDEAIPISIFLEDPSAAKKVYFDLLIRRSGFFADEFYFEPSSIPS